MEWNTDKGDGMACFIHGFSTRSQRPLVMPMRTVCSVCMEADRYSRMKSGEHMHEVELSVEISNPSAPSEKSVG